MIMKVGVVLVLVVMAFTAATVEARFDPNKFLVEMFKDKGEPNYMMKSTTTACCDHCICTKSMPPQCQCTDIGETCHSACKACFCNLSFPPQCRCFDTNNFCYDKCSSASSARSIITGVSSHAM